MNEYLGKPPRHRRARHPVRRAGGENRREYALAVLFTLNAASLQIVPTSVIALRTAAGSAAPSSVVLPILLSSAFFLALALPCTKLVYDAKRRLPAREKRGIAIRRAET